MLCSFLDGLATRGRKSFAGWRGCLLAMVWPDVWVLPRLSGAASISLPCDECRLCLPGGAIPCGSCWWCVVRLVLD